MARRKSLRQFVNNRVSIPRLFRRTPIVKNVHKGDRETSLPPVIVSPENDHDPLKDATIDIIFDNDIDLELKPDAVPSLESSSKSASEHKIEFDNVTMSVAADDSTLSSTSRDSNNKSPYVNPETDAYDSETIAIRENESTNTFDDEDDNIIIKLATTYEHELAFFDSVTLDNVRPMLAAGDRQSVPSTSNEIYDQVHSCSDKENSCPLDKDGADENSKLPTEAISFRETQSPVKDTVETAVENDELQYSETTASFQDKENHDTTGLPDAPNSIEQSVATITVTKDFQPGDNVQVVNSHPKHQGKTGTVLRTTTKFVFLTASDGKTVQIMPKFLVPLACASTEDDVSEISTNDVKSIANEPDSNVNVDEMIQPDKKSKPQVVSDIDASSATKENEKPVADRNQPSNTGPSSKPHEAEAKAYIIANNLFRAGDIVQVIDEHPKHKGKQCTVIKTTAKFVVLVENGASKENQMRVMPKFLKALDCSYPASSETAAVVSSAPSIENRNHLVQPRTSRQSTNVSSQPPAPPPQQILQRLCYGTAYTNEKCLLRQMLSNDILIREYEFPPSKSSTLPPLDLVMHFGGKRYELYYSDVTKDPNKSSKFAQAKRVVAHYVQTENLRELEESLADFGALNPRKVWARRKLFLSKAAKLGNGDFGLRQISSQDIVMLNNPFTVGCGFICEKFLVGLLGDNTAARRAIGVQVRINVPSAGVFKGVLLRKRIDDGPPIQMNESLQKVLPSKSSDADDSGYIVMNRVFPSDSNLQVGRLFFAPDKITKSFRENVKKGREAKLSPMYKQLMNGLGVPTELLNKYSKSFMEEVESLRHTHLVGVADPTCALPPNTIFMTGVSGELDVDEIFVSRSPCLEPEDARMIRVITTKPATMSQQDWDWLHTLHFGALIFANPCTGQRPLPEIIADGDLDGDLYFVCWDKVLLSHINPIPITNQDLDVHQEDTTKANPPTNSDWFEEAQEFICNVSNIVDVNNLTGCLYRLSEEVGKEHSIRHPDAISYAKAYKHALEYKKHGRPITLPAHLISEVPQKFRCLLSPAVDL